MLMFFNDGLLVMPLFLLLVLLAMLVREHMNMVTMVLLFGILGWAWDARLIRSQILSLREREFTYTAILSGTPTRKLIFNEYIPGNPIYLVFLYLQIHLDDGLDDLFDPENV
ncbi:unnamed protein product [marine sediment metagenome]|uniref:ABC transmembrane type-1 domain-containing protein n=1 Tax=marine sediment metagenome TaxID=412755 RepID=X1UUL1_9ZZZZ